MVNSAHFEGLKSSTESGMIKMGGMLLLSHSPVNSIRTFFLSAILYSTIRPDLGRHTHQLTLKRSKYSSFRPRGGLRSSTQFISCISARTKLTKHKVPS